LLQQSQFHCHTTKLARPVYCIILLLFS
jgi:hypothetical protein